MHHRILTMKLFIQLVLLLPLALILAGCSSAKNMHTQTVPDAAYTMALEASNPSKFNLPEPGSPAEAEMLQGIQDLFSTYTYENLEVNTQKVYADEIYFRDAFRLITNSADLRDYMLHGLEPLEGAEFIFNDVARSGGDFYLNWTMRLDFKKTPTGTWEESIGMTRIRFNSEGQVIFHQDFWDPTDIVYRRIPIARGLIGYVKKKL